MPPTTRGKRKRQQAELVLELRRCAWRGNLVRVRELVLVERVPVNPTDSEHAGAPLHLAVEQRHAHVARFLLEHDAHVDANGKYDWTPLACAVEQGNIQLATLLLEHGANVDAQCHSGEEGAYTPLAIAFERRNVGMMRLLLQFGANTKATLFQGKSYVALLLACCCDNVEIIQLLLDHDDGVDVNFIEPTSHDNNEAVSPLCVACIGNKLEIAQFLVQKGARVIFSGVLPDSPCPLKHAAVNGSLELVQFLLDNSPFSTYRKNTPLPAEAGSSLHPLTPPLVFSLKHDELEVAQLLVDRGANVNDVFSVLCLVAANGYCNGARFLLRNGADVNRAHRVSGQTPLWIAAEKGNVKLVREFLKAGADVSMRDNGGETPLGAAYRKGHKGVVYLLLRTSPHVWSRLEKLW